MGVHSLWDILNPSARPVRLEALSRKRLAVDASIWIYQFLKAVRDKEGHSLHNSHIVGFFRRICKLLYFGIQPVFVFDGGAPALKRSTIVKRKERRRDKAETLQQTAAKLLAIQLQKKANEEYQNETNPVPKAKKSEAPKQEGELEFEHYFEDYDYMAGNEKPPTPVRQEVKEQKRKVFRKDDDYHLPDDKEIMADDDDQRMITDLEFQKLTEGLEQDLEGIDMDKVDPTSEEFKDLPLATQYMVLSHLRLRSRLRMGYTKEQLTTLFPKSMDFSRFQISMVQKRNFLTQKLMHVAGMDNTDIVATRRIASERGRAYQLVKNEDGYTLSLSKEGNSSDKPIHLDEFGNTIKQENTRAVVPAQEESEDEEDDEFEFEDVPIDQKGPPKSAIQQENDRLEALFEETESKMMDIYKRSDAYEDQADFQKQVENMIAFHAKGSAPIQFAPKTVTETKTAPKPAPAPLELKTAAPDFPQDFDITFGDSMLNSAPAAASTAAPAPPPAVKQTKERDTAPVRSAAEAKDAPKSKKVAETTVHAPGQLDVENGPRKAQPAPQWFEKSQVGFGKSNPYNTDYSIYNKNNKRSQDEEVGLISAEQAEEYLRHAEEEEEESASEVEVEEVMVEQAATDEADSDVEFVEDSTKDSETKSKSIPSAAEPPREEPKAAVVDYDFSESEEEGLVEQLQAEELEHERFKSTLNNGENGGHGWSLQDEQSLQEQRRKERRDADEVTQGMIQDVQELLSRFGLPFITAPMEAEAQCAELLRLKLVDGIITDDSDCFLFGGDTIYKNMFSEKNYVECYLMDDIERDSGLSRDKMIQLAMLLGSDYTEGIKGVGKVTAMEILAEFASGEDESALVNFRDWWIAYQNGARIDPKESAIRKKLRKGFQQKLFFDLSFPDPLVKDAYLRPEVDHDPTEFKWGSPDLDRLRTFLMYNVGWSQGKVDEVLVPVIRDINKKQQTTLSEFFPRDAFQKRKDLAVGKRLKAATSRLTSNKRQKS